MKRLILSALAVSALTLAAPAAALAQHRHHRRHHHAHHARVLTFKATSTPAGPTTSSPASTESVGMVSSFEGGVLKITLNDGSVVAGKVTERTEIECGSSGHDEDGSGSS